MNDRETKIKELKERLREIGYEEIHIAMYLTECDDSGYEEVVDPYTVDQLIEDFEIYMTELLKMFQEDPGFKETFTDAIIRDNPELARK